MRRFALNKTPKVIACTEQLAHIFEEMYRVPEKARISYFQIKILELLLALDSMTPPKENAAHPYFYKTRLKKPRPCAIFSPSISPKTSHRKSFLHDSILR